MYNCITLSPKYGDLENIKKFTANGCNMFRLNFSWGTHDEYKEIIKNIRQVSKEMNQTILILQDLQGPKLRVQNLDSEMTVKAGDQIQASYNAKPNTLQLEAEGLYEPTALHKHLLIKDGDIKFKIIDVDSTTQTITLESLSNGTFKNMNGCNAPSIELGLDPISTKDQKDIIFALENQIDIISLSFIHNESDLITLKKLSKNQAKICAKIETETAVNNIKSILKHADFCMVARGDLGVEVGLTQLGPAQEKIIQACNQAQVKCLVATEVLKSMLTEKHPSRAESDDIYQCLTQNVKGFILTNETVTGKNPFQATKWITKFLDSYKNHK